MRAFVLLACLATLLTCLAPFAPPRGDRLAAEIMIDPDGLANNAAAPGEPLAAGIMVDPNGLA